MPLNISNNALTLALHRKKQPMKCNIIDRISDVINSSKVTCTNVEWLVLEYCTLQQKLTHPENQSSYFKMGLESHHKRIEYLKMRYSMIYWDYNFSSVDTLIKERGNRIEVKEKLMSQITLEPINKLILDSTLLKIDYYTQLIKLKSRVDYLQKLEYYAENPEAVVKLLGL